MSSLDSLPIFISGGGNIGGGGGSSGDGNGSAIISANTSVQTFQSTINNGQISFTTSGSLAMLVDSNQKIGIKSISPTKRLEINDPNGDCLRMTFNDIYGRSIAYTDLKIKSDGSLMIQPSSGSIYLPYNTISSGLYIGNVLVTASGLQLNTVDVFSFGIAQADKSLILDNNKNISGINSLSASTLTGTNLYGTLNTVSQPNITTIGKLTSLNVLNQIKLQDSNNTILDIKTNNTQYVYMNSFYNTTTPTSLIMNNQLYVTTNNVGINTINPRKSLEICSSTGNCLRLSNNFN
jgi:hypothetical protein